MSANRMRRSVEMSWPALAALAALALAAQACGDAQVVLQLPDGQNLPDAGYRPPPPPEVCGNGADDDGDGSVDEGCFCTLGDTRPCSPGNLPAGAKVCQQGVQTCENVDEFPAWSQCQGAVVSAPEVCNGVDDDCDGQVDESLIQNCSTACGQGTQTCVNGVFGACSARQPSPDVCGNGVDDNCDGQVDETCLCIKSPGLTPWQIHLGAPAACWPTSFSQHGDPGEYAYASIPGENDPGWAAHNAPNISFDDPSTLCGVCDCLAGGDFTYFQTSVDIPAGFTVTSAVVSIANVDDGVRITVYNSAHPQGVVDTGSYAYLGGGSTSNLASLLVTGKNRIVLTHVDDCCAIRRIADATISFNGTSLNPCP